MAQEIAFSGVTAIPPDNICQDGSLTASLNLAPEHDALRALPVPVNVLGDYDLGDGVVVYIHNANQTDHYIVLDNGLLYFLTIDGDGEVTSTAITDALDGLEIYGFTSMGNTLMALTSEGTHYFLWKADEGSADYYYKHLGNHLPELPISFGLQATRFRSAKFKIYLGVSADDHSDYENLESAKSTSYGQEMEFAEDDYTVVTNAVMGAVNKFVADHATNKGRFMHPFFVRYAFRLYDGSTLAMHSAPVLMIPSSGVQPFAAYDECNEGKLRMYGHVYGFACDLDYQVDADALADVKEWSDIITSVDVFISQPIYPYNQSGQVKRIVPRGERGGFSVLTMRQYGKDSTGLYYDDDDMESDRYWGEEYSNDSGKDENGYWLNGETSRFLSGRYSGGEPLYAYVRSDCLSTSDKEIYDTSAAGWNEFELPAYEDGDETVNTPEDVSAFYLLKSFPLDDITAGVRTRIEIADDYLQSLANREAMTDDYDSHDQIIAQGGYTFNSRLNLFNITKTLFAGFPAWQAFGYCNARFTEKGGYTASSTTTGAMYPALWNADIYVYITQGGQQHVVKAATTQISPLSHYWFYYPNANAYKAVIAYYPDDSSESINGAYDFVFTLPLESHDFLNGAYFFQDYRLFDGATYEGFLWDSSTGAADIAGNAANLIHSAAIPNETGGSVSLANKVYGSEAELPFYFPSGNIVTVGTGTVLALATAAKALSEGQFGSFPVYAFTTEGVWALSISTEGVFSAVQPMLRDILIHPQALAQLDSEVIFATKRGALILNGSTAVNATEAIDSEDYFTPDHADILTGLAGLMTGSLEQIPFSEYIEDARFVYDYPHQRIIMYNCGDGHSTDSGWLSYAYVFAIKSRAWGMIHLPGGLASTLNSYPEALAMTQTGELVDFAGDSSEAVPVALVTRPIHLGAPDVLKTMRTVLTRGAFARLQAVLYGSNDLENWALVATSANHKIRRLGGTPYKHFRLCLAGTMYPDKDFITGLSVDAVQKYSAKLR